MRRRIAPSPWFEYAEGRTTGWRSVRNVSRSPIVLVSVGRRVQNRPVPPFVYQLVGNRSLGLLQDGFFEGVCVSSSVCRSILQAPTGAVQFHESQPSQIADQVLRQIMVLAHFW